MIQVQFTESPHLVQTVGLKKMTQTEAFLSVKSPRLQHQAQIAIE
jgi:hypothetical protein